MLKARNSISATAPHADPAGGAYSGPPDHLDLRGPTSKGREGRKVGREGRGRREGRTIPALFSTTSSPGRIRTPMFRTYALALWLIYKNARSRCWAERRFPSILYIHTYIHTNLYSAKNRENVSEALAQDD